MSSKEHVLLCEEHQEIEPLLSGILDAYSLHLVCTANPEMVHPLANETKPELILINTENPEPLCHQLKMNSSLYYIPLFVISPPSEREIELQFLANELFRKPLQSILLIEKIRTYLDNRPKASMDIPARTTTRERWIEKKSGGSYSFDFVGKLSAEQMDILTTRIAELITVGRKEFTINLLDADHIENIPLSKFSRIQEIVHRADGHLKILSHISSITEELSRKGIDIDEYMELDTITRN